MTKGQNIPQEFHKVRYRYTNIEGLALFYFLYKIDWTEPSIEGNVSVFLLYICILYI